jgi:hypothetical protein
MEPTIDDDGSWLVEFRNQLLVLEQRPDPAAKKASDMYFAMLGALSRALDSTEEERRRKFSEQAVELARIGTDSLMSYWQTLLAGADGAEDRELLEGLNAHVLKVRQSLRASSSSGEAR